MTDPIPQDDLVARLLKKDAWTNQKPYFHERNPDGPEAAARITALETALREARTRLRALSNIAMHVRNQSGGGDAGGRMEDQIDKANAFLADPIPSYGEG